MATPEEQKMEVTIIDRSEITTFPTLNTPVVTVAVTYIGPDMPPRTIFIPKSEWSKEKEAEEIRKDIQKWKQFRAERVTV